LNKVDVHFAKRCRLTEANDFASVFKAASYKRRVGLFSFYARRNEQSYSRLGMNIAKKNIRSAVTRNQIKRLIRESFRLNQGELVGLDIVVAANRFQKEIDKTEIRKCLDDQWKKIQSHFFNGF
jgi:ribonuclease P protein component